MIEAPFSMPKTLAASNTLVLEQHYVIEKLRLQIAGLRRAKFGSSSEAIDSIVDQMELTLEDLITEQAAILQNDPDVDKSINDTEAKQKPVRKPLPEHLPRDVTEHLPNGGMCDCCGKALHKIGEDITEVLDYVPASFRVKHHVRPKMACRACDTIKQAPAISLPIEKGKPGPGLLANVLVSKYADHLPLYRQSGIYAREGVDLSRNTMADWVGRSMELVRPLVDAIGKHVMAGPTIHTDDTPVPVQAPGTGKTKTGRIWTYLRDERDWQGVAAPAAYYRYSPDRKGARPQDHLKDYEGFLHADGYAGYEKLYGSGKITEVACLAHVRRKFFDLHKANGSLIAKEALERIAALYGIEKQIRQQPPDLKRQVRHRKAKALFEDLQAWLPQQLNKIPAKSALAGAIRYAITRLKRLEVYLTDGRLAIDNNPAERCMRSIALGRKNFLFYGSDKGGERAAAAYTLLETAKLNGINPQAYLTWVFDTIAEHPVNRIDELLPWNFTEAELEEAA
uniref:IS66 family transposase n=1 Tax=Kordiimonas aquimaris TaxID=707591 RepID=UPI00374D0DEC